MTNKYIMTPQDIPIFENVQDIKNTLMSRGCRLCSLGFQEGINGCCVSRGDTSSNRMVIGEAPGREEDIKGIPFTGPAGKLLDKIFASVGMDTNDWYLTNVTHCRPIAPVESGKQNLTPQKSQVTNCRRFWSAEIRLLNPKIIVTLGTVATSAVLGHPNLKIGDYRGKMQKVYGKMFNLDYDIPVFPMIHPAALLHASSSKEVYDKYRKHLWEDVKMLKNYLIANNIMISSDSRYESFD